jgi:serine/threonine protein kinase
VHDLAGELPSLLSSRYELGAVIGEGGMGVVRRAWDTQFHRYVAVKILHNRATDSISRARFRAEGEALARMTHPNLTTLYHAATEGSEPFLVMELVEGEPLSTKCQGQSLPPEEVAFVAVELADALDHVHRHRIVHRDVKPSNVLISWTGEVKLADFGLVRLLDGITRHTSSGMVMGTAVYLSPEQVHGGPALPASDVYSLGLVLIEALSGRPAFTGSWDVVALARLTSPPRIDGSVPTSMRSLLEHMTAMDPAERPTAAEVASIMRSGATQPRAVTTLSPRAFAAVQVPTAPEGFLPSAMDDSSVREVISEFTRDHRAHGDRRRSNRSPDGSVPGSGRSPALAPMVSTSTVPHLARRPSSSMESAPAPERELWPADGRAGGFATTVRTPPRRKRRPVLWSLVAAAVVVPGLVLVGLNASRSDSPTRADQPDRSTSTPTAETTAPSPSAVAPGGKDITPSLVPDPTRSTRRASAPQTSAPKAGAPRSSTQQSSSEAAARRKAGAVPREGAEEAAKRGYLLDAPAGAPRSVPDDIVLGEPSAGIG